MKELNREKELSIYRQEQMSDEAQLKKAFDSLHNK